MIRFIIKSVKRDFGQYLLATIGLVIGITALISMSYLGIAGKIKLYKEIEKQGINLIYVYPEAAKVTPYRKNISGLYPALKKKDLSFIRNNLLYLDKAVPAKFTIQNVKFGRNILNSVEIIGTDKYYLKILNYQILSGEDFGNNIKGCFIGYTIFKELFNLNLNIIGKHVHIGNQFLKVAGILSPKGASSSGRDKDRIILVPMKVFTEKFKNTDYYDVIYIRPEKIHFLTILKNSTISLLKILHNNTAIPKPLDFSVRSMDYYIRKQNRIGKLMVLTTFLVSSITLLVGGIGVMAVMIILSVKETRDIGVKRAIGATKGNIFLEYIIKSLTIAAIGSFLGVIFGILGYHIINNIYGVNGAFPYFYTFSGIISSFFISLVFGIYPAYKASKIEPYTALHYQ